MTDHHSSERTLNIESRLAQIGSINEPTTGAINFPIYQSTAFRHPALGKSTGFDYIRTTNPTRAVLEQAAAALESADAGFACSSGMAALQTIFALFGQEIIWSYRLICMAAHIVFWNVFYPNLE